MAGFHVSITFSLLVVVLMVGQVYSRERRQARAKEVVTVEEYLEGHRKDVEPPSKNASPLDLYLHLLRLKRREQIETAEKVLSVPDYTKQYKTITMLLEALFPAIQESMMELEKAEYSPNMPFPADRDMQEVVGRVYENVLMFGDFLLRMPEITKKVYSSHKEWTGVFRWAVKFCTHSTDIFTGPYAMHLELMLQELGLGPKDPNYVNPFSRKGKTEERVNAQTRREAMKDKMEKLKGPRLRTNRHHEL